MGLTPPLFRTLNFVSGPHRRGKPAQEIAAWVQENNMQQLPFNAVVAGIIDQIHPNEKILKARLSPSPSPSPSPKPRPKLKL